MYVLMGAGRGGRADKVVFRTCLYHEGFINPKLSYDDIYRYEQYVTEKKQRRNRHLLPNLKKTFLAKLEILETCIFFWLIGDIPR